VPDSLDITKIPAPRVPFFDPQIGNANDPRTWLVARDWYRFLYNLFTITGSGQANVTIDDLLLGPVAQDDSYLITLLNQEGGNPANALPAFESVFASQIQALETPPQFAQFMSQLTQLRTEIDSLSIAPVETPQSLRLTCGSFYDTTIQTAADPDTAYEMSFDTTAISSGVSLSGTQFSIDRVGMFIIEVQCALLQTAGTGGVFVSWVLVNGTTIIPASVSTRAITHGQVTEISFQCMYKFNAGDTFKVIWAVTDDRVRLEAQAASSPYPARPSVSMSVFQLVGMT
jgi:hypothetical protein